MNLSRKGLVLTGLLVFSFSIVEPAWAVYSPEPRSAGRYFQAKGTRASEAYLYQQSTGTPRSFSEYEYGEGLRAGNLWVDPYVGYTREYDSNVFLTENAQKEDWINRLNWGVDAEAPFEDGKYVVRGGVHSESEWFNRFDDEDHTDWIYQLGTELNFNQFQLEVFEEHRRTVSRAGNELTRRIARKENYLVGLLTIPFGEFFSETEVSHYDLVFRDPAFDNSDRDELSFYPRFGVNVGDRTQVLTEYGYTNVNYDNAEDRNGDVHQLAAGLRGFLGEGDLVSYQAWAGWQIRNYDSNSRDDFSGFIFRSDLQYRPNDRTRVIAEVNRLPVESVSNTNSYIVRNTAAISFQRQFAERILLDLGASTGWWDYSDSRDDFYFEPKARVEYLLPGNIVTLFTEYIFSGRESDAGQQDYNRHLWNFGVRAEM